MPKFNYTARDLSGKIVSDTLVAATIDDAADTLRAQRFQILKLKQKSKLTSLSSSTGRLSTVEKANLCRYLATMIDSGLPLIEAVSTIAQDTTNKTLKAILSDVQRGLQQGEALSEVFSRYPSNFDKVFVTIVRAGERSGTLQKSFRYLQEQLTGSHELSQKVKGALIYPAVIISTMIGVGAILIVFVVPQIAQVFLKTNLPIPKITTMLLQGGLTLNQNLHLIGISFAVLVLIAIFVFRTSSGRKVVFSSLKQVPVVSKIFEKLDLARFSRTLATLMQSGVPITQSLEVATITLTHRKFAPISKALTTDIKKGESISSILRAHKKHIPQLMISMVSTGEKTGNLDKILFDLAAFYEQELENEIKNFTAILEPVVMLIIGVGVGAMVVSVIAPIYSLVSSLQELQH